MTRPILVAILGLAVVAPACIKLYDAEPPTCRERFVWCPGDGGAGGAEAGGSAGAPAGGSSGNDPSEGGSSGDGSAGTNSAAGGASGEGGYAGAAGSGGSESDPCSGSCGGATPICNEILETCVECTEKAHCSDEMPVCDGLIHVCVECRKKADCPTDRPFCDLETSTCLACLEDEDCKSPSASRCVEGECMPCSASQHCAHLSGRTVCDVTASQCVECTGKEYSTCGEEGGVPLVCDSLTRTCRSFRQRSAGLCQPCVSDAHCRAGQLCVLERYGNPPEDAGYFCQWKRGDVANGAPVDCATARPYVAADVDIVSIDGETADVCGLRVSTCSAHQDFGAKDCAPTGTPDPSLCGTPARGDAECAPFGTTLYRCTVPCLSDDDCRVGTTCDTGVNPPVCQL